MENSEDNNQSSNKSTAIILVVLILSVLGNGFLGYMLMQEKKTVTELRGENVEIEGERDELELELEDMLAQYNNLETENDSMSVEMEAEKAKIEELMAKVKSSNWTIYKLKKETESLRTIMKGFVHTIDSLNTANIELQAENQNIKGELGAERTKSERLSSEKNQLEGKVKIGQKLQAVFIESYAQLVKGNTIHKRTEKAKKADKIKCCFTIGANELAKSGKKNVYLRVIGPSGSVLTLKEDKANMFEFDGVRGLYSVKKEVMYENTDLDVCLYWVVEEELTAGKYIVYAYAEDHEIGVTEFTLK